VNKQVSDTVKVVNIMYRHPAYELFRCEPRPKINWDTPDGRWVGMWGLDVPDLLGIEILRLTNEFEYEVWQPDLRADRVYSHIFSSGLIRRSFPAINRRRLYGFKFINQIYSKVMIRELVKVSEKDKLILHMNGNPLLYKHFMSLLCDLPMIFDFRGTVFLPQTRLLSRTINIPGKFNHIVDHYWLKKNIRHADYIIYRNDRYIQSLREIYGGRMQKLTSGCDFSFWRPRDCEVARKELGLPRGKKIFFIASRLVAGKQIDKMICVFSELADAYDFLLIIAGHGRQDYENYLKKMSMDLLNKNKVIFVGFLSGEKFRSYYNASNFFVLTSTSEGGSVAVMNAFACGIPVISTKTGHTAELMEQYRCGCLLDIHNYKMWSDIIEKILKDELVVKPFDREIAKKYYGWQNVARGFVDIYRALAKKYYS
jgi:glycosyltransferase involved in cell wall biosynthesis